VKFAKILGLFCVWLFLPIAAGAVVVFVVVPKLAQQDLKQAEDKKELGQEAGQESQNQKKFGRPVIQVSAKRANSKTKFVTGGVKPKPKTEEKKPDEAPQSRPADPVNNASDSAPVTPPVVDPGQETVPVNNPE
jgi:hypothetical protein